METGSKKPTNKVIIVIGVFGALIFVLCICLIVGALIMPSDKTKTRQIVSPSQIVETQAQEPMKEIEYQIIHEWVINNGGYGRVLLIDPKFRNENDLKKLGEEIKDTTLNDRNAFVFVYDDIKAAQMQENVMNLNEDDGAFYDEHFVLTYSKNINTGLNQLVIMVDGLNGDSIIIDY